MQLLMLLAVGVEEPVGYPSCVQGQACAWFCLKSIEVRLQRNRKYLDKSFSSMVPTSRKLTG